MKSTQALRVPTIGLAIAGLLAGCLAASLTGCRGEETEREDTARVEVPPKAPPPAAETTPAKPDSHPGTYREQLSREIELPEAYPDDGPVYPGAKINSSAWRAGRLSVTFSTKDSVSKVAGQVRQQLRSDGWTSLPETEMPSGVVIDAAKDSEARAISVMIATIDEDKDDGLTLIAVVTDPKK